jgi:hypothetical protein
MRAHERNLLRLFLLVVELSLVHNLSTRGVRSAILACRARSRQILARAESSPAPDSNASRSPASVISSSLMSSFLISSSVAQVPPIDFGSG